jgi:UDP-glucose 4-epimerase
MKILVTGGAGFIGSHVVDAFVAAGHEVVVVDDLSTGNRGNLNPAAKFRETDIRSPEMAEVFEAERPEVVSHLAAQINVTRSVKEPVFDAETNIVGTINLLENCVKHEVKRFVFSSTAGAIYGEPDHLPAPETCEPNPMSQYGVSKLAAEYYIRLYKMVYGLPYVILRYSNVFGPRQVPHGECGVCAVLTDLMMAGKQPTLFGHGTPLRDYVYVGDVARANLLALENGDNATMHIASGKGTSVMEIFDALKELTGFEGEPILKDLRPGEVDQIYTTRDRAKEFLGWEPQVGLREGLAQVAAPHKDER